MISRVKTCDFMLICFCDSRRRGRIKAGRCDVASEALALTRTADHERIEDNG